jgi:ABC-type nitrate/sulfonate/bicarbonate transport system permease component
MTFKVSSSFRAKWIPPLIAFVAITIAWQIIGSAVNPLFLSTPTRIGAAFVELAAGTGDYSLTNAMGITFSALVVGFLIGAVLGLPLGLLMGLSKPVETAFDPYVNAMYVIPRIALVPIIIIWFGVGFEAIVIIVMLHTFFPIVINTHAGIRNLDKAFVDASDAFGVRGFDRFRRVIFPASLPYIMTGLRLGLGQAFIGVIVAQLILALTGLGFILTAYSNYLDTAEVMALILIVMAFGVILTESVKQVERRLAYWKTSGTGIQ